MGEIKSTLEIALEKAKAVKISSEDRQRFKREETLSEARNIFQRYTNHPSRSASLAALITESGKDADLLKQCLIATFVKALDLSHSSERIWDGLGELGLEETRRYQESLARIVQENERLRREAAEKVEKAVLKSLAESGISGTAVDLNIEGTAQWKNALESLDQKVSAELAQLRQEILHVIENHSSSAR